MRLAQCQTLYDLGARKFAVIGTGLIGCTPARRSSTPSGDCNQDLNDLSLRFKTATKALLEELSISLQGFKYSFGDLYEITARVFSNPLAFGEHLCLDKTPSPIKHKVKRVALTKRARL